MAEVAKALGDPVRVQLVDVLRGHAGKVCVCGLVPLFDLSQPTVSHHLKVLREAGTVGFERVGLWAYCFVIPNALKQLSSCMAELTNDCCTPATQATCCGPSEKAACCGEIHTDGCRCATGAPSTAADAASGAVDDVRETVREKYAATATALAAAPGAACCSPADEIGVFGSSLYSASGEAGPEVAVSASLGCGVPTAVADLREGETVLDLGSGAGADVLICARRVGATGKAIGIDITDEMLELARQNAADAGVSPVEFRKGYLEELPLEDESVDVVISNCVINLSADMPKVLAEAARVLRPGGRFAVSDVIADPDMDEQTKADMAAWTGCIAGALTETELRDTLAAPGLDDVEINETHRVHEHAAAAIIRATKPKRARKPDHQQARRVAAHDRSRHAPSSGLGVARLLAMRARAARRGLEVAGGDDARDQSEQPAEVAFGKALLEARSAVAAGEPAGTEAGAEDPLRCDRTAVHGLKDLVGRDPGRPATSGTCGEGRGRDFVDGVAERDQDRREDRAAADPVEPADDADHERQQPCGLAVTAGRCGLWAREVLRAEQEPEPEREQYERGDQGEAALAGEHLDAEDRAGDHAWERVGDQQPAQRAAEPPLAREPQQSARGRGDVDQQVGWGDRRAGDVQHAGLDREQQHRPGHASRRGREREQKRQSGANGPLPVHPRSVTPPVNSSESLLFLATNRGCGPGRSHAAATATALGASRSRSPRTRGRHRRASYAGSVSALSYFPRKK